jgi:hypothetical protein
MRLAVCALLGLVACDNAPSIPPIDSGPPPPPPWWTPQPRSARDWDIQLFAPFDVSMPHKVYVLETLTLVPAKMLLDYGDPKPIELSPGALKTAIADLHARTPPAIVICHVDTGAVRLTDPDASKFPGFAANPPDMPTVPAMGSVIGWSIGDPNLRLLDIREASRDAFASLIWKRLDLAAQLGCDGVMPDHNDVAAYESGFDVMGTDSLSWYLEVAKQAHARALSVGMKDGTQLIDPTTTVPAFDWLVIQGCGENHDCDTYAQPFETVGKDTLDIDYFPNDSGIPVAGLCTNQAGIVDGIVKKPTLDSTFLMQCMM